jgi:CRP/FNR family transcriptional regulator, cyclic AMP receptor protein
MPESAAKSALRAKGWLASEPDWLRDALLGCAKLRTYQVGEYAYHLEDEPGGMFGIVSGGFGVIIPSGAEMALCHVLRAGAWFGLGPVLTNGRRTFSFQAVEQSQALTVSLGDLHSIGARNPELYRRLGGLSEQSMQNIAARVVGDLLIPSGERRIAAVLTRLAGGGHSPAVLRLSQAMIAQMSNSSRDRVNRTLRKFATQGWLQLGYQTLTIIDSAALERFSRGSA